MMHDVKGLLKSAAFFFCPANGLPRIGRENALDFAAGGP